MTERLLTKRQCARCGRYGTHGFRRLSGGGGTVLTVCVALKACGRRIRARAADDTSGAEEKK